MEGKIRKHNKWNVEVEVKSTVLKVLGLTWRTEQDDFIFDLRNLIDFLKNKSNTKRGVLQAAAHIFGPIGFLSPFTIRVKCLFQKCGNVDLNGIKSCLRIFQNCGISGVKSYLTFEILKYPDVITRHS